MKISTLIVISILVMKSDDTVSARYINSLDLAISSTRDGEEE